jgi:sugar lactone lactonase
MNEDDKRADPGHGRSFVLDVAARGRAEPDVRLDAG